MQPGYIGDAECTSLFLADCTSLAAYEFGLKTLAASWLHVTAKLRLQSRKPSKTSSRRHGESRAFHQPKSSVHQHLCWELWFEGRSIHRKLPSFHFRSSSTSALCRQCAAYLPISSSIEIAVAVAINLLPKDHFTEGQLPFSTCFGGKHIHRNVMERRHKRVVLAKHKVPRMNSIYL